MVYRLHSLGNGLHPVGSLTTANYALNPSMEVGDPSVSLNPTILRTNLAVDPLNTNSALWAVYNGTTRSTSTANFYYGSTSTLVTTGIASGLNVLLITNLASAAGNYFGASFYARSNSGHSVTIGGQVVYYHTGSGLINSSNIHYTALPSDGSWVQIVINDAGVAPATANQVGILIYTSGATVGDQYNIDAVLLEQETNPGPYFDGAGSVASPQYNYAWTGTANNSSSTMSTVFSRTNILPNPSFEIDTSGWATNGTSITRDLGYAYSGSASLRLNTSAAAQAAYVTPALTANINTLYSGSAYVRGTGTAQLCLAYSPGGSIFARSQTITLSSQWQRISTQGTITGGNSVYVLIYQQSAGSNVMWIDNVLIENSAVRDYFDGSVDLSVSRINLCANPNFESGTTGWTPGGTTAPTVSSSTDQKIFGKQSLKIAWANSPANDSTVTYAQATTIGTVYTYSVYVYVPSGNSPVILQAGGATSTSTIYDDWQRLYVTFTATSTSHPLVIQESQNTSGVAYVEAAMISTGALSDYFDSTTPKLADGRWQIPSPDTSGSSLQLDPTNTIAWTGTAQASTSTLTMMGVKNWTASNANVKWDSTVSIEGNYCARVQPISLSQPPKVQQTFDVIDSTNYSVSFYIFIPQTLSGGGIEVQFDCYDQTNTLISSTPTPLLLSGNPTTGFIRLATTFMTPPGTLTMTVNVQELNQPTSLFDTWYVDSFMLEQADTPSLTYIDGDFAGLCWAGTPQQSMTLYTEFPSALNFFGTTIWQTQAPSPAGSLAMGSHPTLQLGPWSPVPLTD